MRLLLDNHYSPEIARRLRKRGHDADAAVERGWQGEDDETLLALCAGERRTLLTNNVRDFTGLAQLWAAEGRTHAGLIFTSHASLPRGRDTIGRYVSALHTLLNAYRGDADFTDRVHWL